MSTYDLAGKYVNRDVVGARTALAEGLRLLRSSMREGFGTTQRGAGGLPRTRQRPHPNEAPAGRTTGANGRPAGSRTAPRAAPPASDTGPGLAEGAGSGTQGAGHTDPGTGTDTVAPPGVDGATLTVDVLDPPAKTGGDGPGTGYPDRPDPSDAAAEVWALVERAQAGEAEAFGLIYDRYFDTVFRFVYFRVGNRQLAEDLTADTFLRALKRIGSFTWQGRDLGAWLVTIARNLVADHFKSGRYRLEVTTGDVLDAEREDRGPEGSPESAVVDHITNVELLKAVKQLNPEQQECIVLRFLQGFSVAETAQAMGKNEGAIKALQYRAVRALARLLPDGFQS